MPISFDLIPNNIRVPGAYIEISNALANRGLTGYPSRVLVIGQKLDVGSRDELVASLITSKEQGVEYFGAGSQLANMIERFKDANSFIQMYAIALDDNEAAAAAGGALTITGPATAAGTINLYIAGRLVQAGVAATDTASEIATALAAAVNADASLPVTAAVDGDDNFVVNITAKNAGEAANYIDLRVNYYDDQMLPGGIGVAITAMSGGSANPDVGDVFAAIGDEWFTDIVCPYTDTANLVELEAQLLSRFGPLKQIEGKAYVARAATHANLVTAGQGRNSHLVSAPGVYGSPTPPYELAAVYGAICAFNLQNDPARPLQDLALPGVLAPKIADRFMVDENNILLWNGIATLGYAVDGTVLIQRAITGYRENKAGADDPSYLDIETVATVAYLRYDTRTSVRLKYPNYKLADDGTNFGEGQPIVTPSIIRSFLLSRFKLWVESGLAENFEQYKRDLIVERAVNDTERVNVSQPVDIVNGMRIFASRLDFLL